MRTLIYASLFLFVLSFAIFTKEAFSHGSMETPVSRIYNCFLENPENPKSDACKAAVQAGGTQGLYDWNGVNQANANDMHMDIIPDGKLCSAGKELFQGIDLARNDWPSTMIAPDSSGRFNFVFIATAPHSTDYFKFYVTKDGYDPLSPLKWSDLEASPFCTIIDVTLENGRYAMNCPLPQGKTGKHVIYTIWQRDDSTEAFYTCIDVEFSGGVPVVWKSIGQVRAQQDLTVGDTVTFRLFDASGGDAETITLELEDGQTFADQWPFYLAEHVNTSSSIVKIGVLDAEGSIIPVQSSQNNNVYILSEEDYTFQIDIEMSDNQPGEGLTTDVYINDDWGSGYCAEVTVTNNTQSTSDWKVTFTTEGFLTDMWNASYTQSGDEITAEGVSWNNLVDPGKSVEFGFCADRGASPTMPPATPAPTSTPTDPPATPTPTVPPSSACSDGVDNDSDGLIDFPDDPGCESENDNDEFNEAGGGDIEADVFINDDWGRGYCAVVTVRNNTSSANDWVVSFPIEGTVRNMWSATYEQSGNTVTAQGVNWNNIVQSGSTTSFGFCAIR